jgi:predicted SAM-dependent methyltransferase
MPQSLFQDSNKKIVLHVGCGLPHPERLHQLFRGPEWKEVRLDIDASVQPDIVASLTNMQIIESECVDAVYSSHCLEHLYPHEVPFCLQELLRVLKLTGFALITLPDLQAVAKLIAADKLDEPAYQSPAGPIAPMDILYGHRASMALGNLYMAHRTGFTAKTLSASIIRAGFAWVKVAKDNSFNLWAKAYKRVPPIKVAEAPMW